MKSQIPEQLKADIPQTAWGKILTATPVVMTVVATLLAGLSSSEMTRAQYDRSLAAQQQSKAGDQWGYFQAKRLRSTLQRNTLDLLQSTVRVHPLEASALPQSVALNPRTRAALEKGELPDLPPAAAPAPKVKAALDAVAKSGPEPEIAGLLAEATNQELGNALQLAKDRAAALDALLEPVTLAIDSTEKVLSSGTGTDALNRDFTAARLRYQAARYDLESRLNRDIANVYELQVRKSNLSAERHHRRSTRFFYGMLGAQAAVIVSTFAMAARQRNWLWSLAAAAGLAAVSFAVYVYLCM